MSSKEPPGLNVVRWHGSPGDGTPSGVPSADVDRGESPARERIAGPFKDVPARQCRTAEVGCAVAAHRNIVSSSFRCSRFDACGGVGGG